MEESGTAIYHHSWVRAIDGLRIGRDEILDENTTGKPNFGSENIAVVERWLNTITSSDEDPTD